jgi:ABC-type multidrug transport system fused ATPase/permease subunit
MGTIPGGLGASVGERGALLSAGERRLLALARVALVAADVLILDEPTSSLDPGTERQVNAALESIMRDRRVVVIAHRLSTMKEVDRIAVIADGAIAEIGSHGELVARRGRYERLYGEWLRAGQVV